MTKIDLRKKEPRPVPAHHTGMVGYAHGETEEYGASRMMYLKALSLL